MLPPMSVCKGEDAKALQKRPHLLHYIKSQSLYNYFIVFSPFGLACLGSDIFRNELTDLIFSAFSGEQIKMLFYKGRLPSKFIPGNNLNCLV